MHMDVIRVMGRAAQGVRLINLKGNAAIAAVARVPRSEDEEGDLLDEDGNVIERPESDAGDESGEAPEETNEAENTEE